MIIKTLHFDDIEDFAISIADKYDEVKDNDGLSDVSVIGKYEEIRAILKELMCLGYDLVSASIENPEWDGYNMEYSLALNSDGLWIEPAYREEKESCLGGYIYEESAVTYILDDCNSKVLANIKSPIQYEVEIGDCCDECDGCCDCEKSDSGITITVNGKEITDENEIRKYLLSYCEYMDEINEFLKIFNW